MVKVFLPLLKKSDNIQRVVDVLVSMELGLDIAIAEDTELGRQMSLVGSQDLTVERQRRNECPLRGGHCCTMMSVNKKKRESCS